MRAARRSAPLSSSRMGAPTPSTATPGKWGIRHDAFRRLTTIRSFEYPGFFAFYSGVSNTVGNLYFGDGLENKDLGFCAA